jgi:hypothetical protein
MTDNYYPPQKKTSPVVAPARAPVPQQVDLTALRQAVEEAMGEAVPIIYATGNNPDINLHITVNIQL